MCFLDCLYYQDIPTIMNTDKPSSNCYHKMLLKCMGVYMAKCYSSVINFENVN